MQGTITKHVLKGGRISWGYVHDAGRGQDGNRRQVVRRGFRLQREAEDALRDAIGDRMKDKGIIEKDSRSFEVFFRSWLEDHSAKRWSGATAETAEKRAGYAIKMFGSAQMQQLTTMRLENDFTTLLRQGGRKTKQHPEGTPLSAKMVREVGTLTKRCLNKAVKFKLIPSNPMNDVELPHVKAKEVHLIEPDQYEKFLFRVQGTRYYALSVVAADSGARRGELLALTWKDVDFDSGTLSISKSLSETKAGLEVKPPKSGKTRHVRISQTAIKILWEHKARLEEEKRLYSDDYRAFDLVFPRPDGDYYGPDQVTTRICEFMKQAGVPASLHKLRHFHASVMLSRKVPIPVVSKRLGHANPKITLQVYSHAMKHDEAMAPELFDEATGAIIERTRPPVTENGSAPAHVISRYSKNGSVAIN